MLDGGDRPRINGPKSLCNARLLSHQKSVERLGRYGLLNKLRLTPEQGPDEARVVTPGPGGEHQHSGQQNHGNRLVQRAVHKSNEGPVHGNRLTRLA